MSSGEWSLPAVHDVVSAAVPDRDMVVWGDVRRTYAEVRERTRGLAAFLVEYGVGVQQERDELERWECGQDPVALVLRNCPEYLETMLGSYRARAVPFNVNHHYTPGEMRQLFHMLDPTAVVYHRSLGPVVEAALAGRGPLLVDVDDASGEAALLGSTNFEDAVSTEVSESLPEPSPDDLYMVCTGGTTGRPKAVLWRQADIFVAGMAGSDLTTADSLTDAATGGHGVFFATPPLMHAAAQWTAYSGLHSGATIVLHEEGPGLDARAILEAAERERVQLMSIVGDAYARPLVEELRRRTYDLTELRTLATGGAATNERYKEALLELIPNVTIIDGYGASETGGMAFGARSRDTHKEGFSPGLGATVVSEDRTRFVEPGDEEVGWIARRGRVPLGYLGDREKTEATFPLIDGERVTVPGDRGQLMEDGRILMLGRDSLVINTGGEKVFVEEVEEVLRGHDDVVDALVVGRDSDRFGQEVVAVVQLTEGASVSPSELREFVAGSLARFKAPRAVAMCDQVHRLANGKADYAWARQAAVGAVEAV
jgi:fatty-acyl-CoA synthase